MISLPLPQLSGPVLALRTKVDQPRSAQRGRNAAVKDVQILLRKEECAGGTVQRSNYAAMQDAQIMLTHSLTHSGGVCTKHGAKKKIKLCSAEGCSNQVRNNGVCRRHGARNSGERLKKQMAAGGEKRKKREADAGAGKDEDGPPMKKTSNRNRPCKQEGCPNQAYKGGVCRRHGAKVKMCEFEGGCTNQAKKGGLCYRHGAKVKQRKGGEGEGEDCSSYNTS